jgi:transposase
MAKYKRSDAEAGQGMFLTVNLKEQLLPETFEYTLNKLIDNEIDVSEFDSEYKNDKTGRPGIDPRTLLKLILYGYSHGMQSSRKIEELSRDNIIAKALTRDIEADHSTIAGFVSGNSEKLKKVFTCVLMVCGELKLIGGEKFAIDGCRLPSNAAKEWSGTHEKLRKKKEKFEALAVQLVNRHKENDEKKSQEENTREGEAVKKLKKKAEYIKKFLEENEGKERKGSGGKEIQSNVTDNESAKIKGPHGVIQGYTGIAVADSKAQVIVCAEAQGTDYEGGVFPGALDNLQKTMKEITKEEAPIKEAVVLADTNYSSEANLKAAEERGIKVLIPDTQFRVRDERFAGRRAPKKGNRFILEDFKYNKEEDTYICPNGKKLIYRGLIGLRHGQKARRWSTADGECAGCPYIGQCITSHKMKREEAEAAEGAVKREKKPRKTLYLRINGKESLMEKMRQKIDEPEGKALYSWRMQIIEPCFANIEYCKGLNRFTLRTQKKVNGQWLLFCLVHNIGKCVPYYAQKRRLMG